MTTERKDIANTFGDVYSKTAVVLLAEIHDYLFQKTEDYLSSIAGKKTFAVLGPGPTVLPFSTNPERVSKMIGEGSMILMDYVFDTENVAKTVEKLQEVGFFDYLEVGDIGKTNPKHLRPRSVNFLQGDLRNNLPFPENSIDCIDSTLAIHHATPFAKDLDRITREVYRVLKHGGMFHFGTGNVDMKYSEKKIEKIVSDWREYNQITECSIIDARDTISSSQIQNNNGPSITIMSDGTIQISNNAGFGNKYALDSDTKHARVSMPLINLSIPDDNEGLGRPVNKYYDAVMNKVTSHYNAGELDQVVYRQFSEAVAAERTLALKGLTEYYTGKPRLLKSLQQAGFKIDTVKHFEPFYSVVATK